MTLMTSWAKARRAHLAPATYQTLLLPQLTDRGVALVAVSPQTPDGSLSTQEKRS